MVTPDANDELQHLVGDASADVSPSVPPKCMPHSRCDCAVTELANHNHAVRWMFLADVASAATASLRTDNGMFRGDGGKSRVSFGKGLRGQVGIIFGAPRTCIRERFRISGVIVSVITPPQRRMQTLSKMDNCDGFALVIDDATACMNVYVPSDVGDRAYLTACNESGAASFESGSGGKQNKGKGHPLLTVGRRVVLVGTLHETPVGGCAERFVCAELVSVRDDSLDELNSMLKTIELYSSVYAHDDLSPPVASPVVPLSIEVMAGASACARANTSEVGAPGELVLSPKKKDSLALMSSSSLELDDSSPLPPLCKLIVQVVGEYSAVGRGISRQELAALHPHWSAATIDRAIGYLIVKRGMVYEAKGWIFAI